MPSNKLTFSVVVCSYNGAGHIAKTLRSLSRLKYPRDRFEVVVVDDGSRDQTVKIVSRFKRVRIVSHEQNQGIAKARNTGLKAAQGRFVAYVDDDCTVGVAWLNELETALKQPHTMAAGGLIAAQKTTALGQRYMVDSGYGRPAALALGAAGNPAARFVAYLRDKFAAVTAKPNKAVVDVHEVYGANVAFAKTKLRAIKGFNPDLNTSEDADVCTRLHQKFPDKAIRFNPNAIVKHHYSASFGHYLRKLFTRQTDTLRYYQQQAKLPPLFPFPPAILALSAASFLLIRWLPIVLLVGLPLLSYSWWLVGVIKKRRADWLAYPYMQLAEESVRLAGLAWAGTRQVAARFGQLLRSQTIAKPFAFGALGLWLLVFNLLQLTHSPLQTFVATSTLLVLPGVLLLTILRVSFATLRGFLYMIILSVALLMGMALLTDGIVLLSHLHLRLSQPLFLGVFDTATVGLGIAAYFNRDDAFARPRLGLNKIASILCSALLPLLGATGTIILNNTGNNVLSMAVLGLVFVLLAGFVIFFKKLPKWFIPLALYALSFTVLLMGSLRGSIVGGTDISKEFYLYNLVQHLGYWAPSIYQDPYNSCLSIHLLPTMVSDLTRLSGETIYRTILPAIYSLVPVMVYTLYRRFSTLLVAAAGALFFVIQPVFMKWSAIPERQMMGFVFFAGLLLVLFDKKLSKYTRFGLAATCGAAMICSHYSTAYIALGVLVLAYVVLRGKYWIDRLFHRRVPQVRYVLTAPLLAVLIGMAALWYGPVTHASGHVLELSRTAFTQLREGHLNVFGSDAHSEQANLFDQFNIASKPRQPQDVWNEYTKQLSSKYARLHITPMQSKFVAAPITANAPPKMPETAPHNIVAGTTILSQVISKLTRVFLAIGLLLFAWWFVRSRKRRLEEIGMLALASAVTIVLIIVVPYASIDYDIGRTSQQLLVLLALPTIIGGMALLRTITWKRFSERSYATVIASVVVLSFVFVSYFVPQLTGGQQPSNMLNNGGVQYQIDSHGGEMAAAQWLAANRNQQSRVYSGYFGRNRLWEAGIPGSSLYNDILPWTIDKYAYVYASTSEVQQNQATTYYNGSFVTYQYPTDFLNARKDILYSSNQARIYK